LNSTNSSFEEGFASSILPSVGKLPVIPRK
jgi:hypothetical protein